MDWKTIDPGTLIHRVELWRDAGGTFDANNQEILTPTQIGTYWSLVEPLTGRELYYASQVDATVDIRVTMRNVGTILPRDWLIFETRQFEIMSVFRVQERNEFYALMCRELKTG